MEEKIRSFQDLRTWKEGHKLVVDVYRVTFNFPSREQYGLTSQMQRSAVSITSNIAEGFGRQTYKEKIRFYFMSKGSLTELLNQFLIARDVGYLDELTFGRFHSQVLTVHRLLNALISSSQKRL
ncbi:MAG: four helix bundle protein [bacterium]|nr:four helix bundle protein [bacterium]